MSPRTPCPTSSQVECTIPVLPVRDLDRTIAFYTEVLGFKVDWIGEQKLAASVSRDGCSIMFLKHANWPGPAWVWIGWQTIHSSKPSVPPAPKSTKSPPTKPGPTK